MAYTIHTGNVLDILPTLPANSVHCVCTSPPYFALRNYEVDGQIGMEPTPQEYVATLMRIFEEVRRVLRPDGTCFLNLGDSYAGSGGAGGDYNEGGLKAGQPRYTGTARAWANGGGRDVGERTTRRSGFKPKDLMLIPFRVAIALQDAGWWVRQVNIWHKPNPMPSSAADRTTTAHEYIFHLTKSANYYYDAEAIKEPAVYAPDAPEQNWQRDNGKMTDVIHPSGSRAQHRPDRVATGILFGGTKQAGSNGNSIYSGNEYMAAATRNKRSVWTIAPAQYRAAHFATFPTEIPRLCILAGCPPGGVVLDPFMGSGTTLAVAQALGRDSIGIEINPAYVEMAHKRIAATQPALFGM